MFYGGNFRFFLCVEKRQWQLEIKSNSFYREFMEFYGEFKPINCLQQKW